MSEAVRVQQLIEEMLDSGSSVEEVCLASPELMPQVREGWRKLQAIRDQIGALFPEMESAENHERTAPEIGLPLVAGYEISEVLGRGGVGVVYKAVHAALNRTVALKMLLAGGFATRAERQRFAREAELVAKLRHPNIVQVHDVGDLDGLPYFTMEFVEGGSLAEKLAGTPRPAREAAELMGTLARAMHAAHQAGIVHRDLKPSNVLLTAEGIPKISDFGLARYLEGGSSLTQSGAALGTPSYMAPEQARGKSREIGPLADIYALGAILYELLTGRPPFRAETAAETIHQVITEEPAAPSRLNARVPRDLETICLKCLRKDSVLRYASAAAMAEDLGRFLRGETIEARPENWLQRLVRRVRRRPVFSASVVGGTLVMMGSLGTGLLSINERRLAERSGRVELAAMEEAAREHLREMSRWLEKSAWPEAGAALERARGRLGNRGSAEIRRLVDRKAGELKLAVKVDSLRMVRATSVGGRPNTRRLAGEHRLVFSEAGLGAVGEKPENVAARIRASGIRKTLVAMVDECALDVTESPRDRHWFVAVARLADDDPTGWRNRVRGLKGTEGRSVLLELARVAPLDDVNVPMYMALSLMMWQAGEDPAPFLKRVQRSYPNELWINFKLGMMLHLNGDHAEAIRYLQAALATRKDAGFLLNQLGDELREVSRFEESEAYLRQALRIDPTAAAGHHNLAVTLEFQGRFDEAIKESRQAIQFLSEMDGDQLTRATFVHQTLGDCLNARGNLDEAAASYRKAIALDRENAWARRGLRAIEKPRGPLQERLTAWQATLASKPHNHQAWYGYAELSLFLGEEEEYGQARRDLLDRFGTTKDLNVAERTSRACLLRPLSVHEMEKIVSLIEYADRFDHAKYPEFARSVSFVHGLLAYRQGQFDQAVSRMQGEASRVLGPAPRLILAMALHKLGRVEEARKTLAEAIASHDWIPAQVRDQDDWICHVLRHEAEALILPEPVGLPGRVPGLLPTF
jgi:serine/threonine protein kinase/tetratricopeptide (TPR) repeat protein